MNHIETCVLLVRLYADHKHYAGEDLEYAEAVAIAIAALTKEGAE